MNQANVRSRGARQAFITLAATCLLLLICVLAGNRKEPMRNAEVISWRSHGRGFPEFGSGGNFVYATSVEPYLLDVWEWNGHTLNRLPDRAAPKPSLDLHWIGSGIIADLYKRNGSGAVCIVDPTNGEVVREWTHPQGWYTTLIQVSRNGEYVGIIWGEIVGEGHRPGVDYDHPQAQVGIIGPDRKGINWNATLVGADDTYNSIVKSVLPSDDGAYVAVAGYGNEMAVVDVTAKKPLWVKRPPREVSLQLAAFSPDSSIVYTGGTSAAVYAYDVKSGKLLDTWWASPTGKEEYGHRMSSLAVSPDGRWIAAGTGPQGLIFICSTDSGKVVATLDHGGGPVLIVHFSPDSQALASFVPGTLKIWKTSLWSKDAAAASQATSSPVTSKPTR